MEMFLKDLDMLSMKMVGNPEYITMYDMWSADTDLLADITLL